MKNIMSVQGNKSKFSRVKNNFCAKVFSLIEEEVGESWDWICGPGKSIGVNILKHRTKDREITMKKIRDMDDHLGHLNAHEAYDGNFSERPESQNERA